MKKEQPSHKWTSDETNLFCEILADLVNNFMETFIERGTKKSSSSEVFDSIIAEFKENIPFKDKKSKNFKTKKKETKLLVEVEAFP